MEFFDSLYDGNNAFWSSGGIEFWLYLVTSGVLQGCPLSGSLFVIAIDPLLCKFERYILDKSLGTVTACADDIGAFLEGLKDLPIWDELFELFRRVSGLTLKARKCVIVLLAINASECNLTRVKQWLGRFLPNWATFCVADQGKYLGFFLGPGGVGRQWEGPLAKHKERANEAAKMDLPLQLKGARFNSRAVTVFGYVAQLAPLPKGLTGVEMASGSKALGFAPTSLNNGAVYSLDKWKGVRLVQPSLYAIASRLRACLKTLSGFQEQHESLLRLALEGGAPVMRALDKEARDLAMPDGWMAPAFCTVLTHTKTLSNLECNRAQ